MVGGFPVTATTGSCPNGAIRHSQNPNTMQFNHVDPSADHNEKGGAAGKRPIEEMGNGSGSIQHNEGGSSRAEQPPESKKQFHRHTPHQINQMKLMFEECPHPNEEQRKKLSEDLGLSMKQIKFWFQNQRTVMKIKSDRTEIETLRSESEILKDENSMLREALRMSGSGYPGQMSSETQLDNTLRAEYERLIGSVNSTTAGSSMQTMGPAASPRLSVSIGNTGSIAMQLALSSLDELKKMCQAVDPLGIHTEDGLIPNLQTEASREAGVVMMNSITLVDTFLDGDKWMDMFPCMILNAKTVQTIGSPGIYHGSLRLMHAEMQMLSPLVPTRDVQFVRYCHKDDDGSWAIVDFPLDSLRDFNPASPSPVYKRKPSGCIIQDMQNGYSRVTWVEHVEVNHKPAHQIFNQFVSSGMAFGAAKWLAELQRQCERIARFMAPQIPDLGGMPSLEARKELMNLAKRMMRSFFDSISSSGGQWMAVSDFPEDTVRISTRRATEPGHPIGLIIGAASTTWLPYSHLQVFDLLGDGGRRAQMEVLSDGNLTHEIAHIETGSHPRNGIFLFGIDAGSSRSQSVQYMLQESYINQSEAVIAYTTLDRASDNIPVLPRGFVVVPVNQIDTTTHAQVSNSGCLLTVSLQALASPDPYATVYPSNVNAIHHRLRNTVNSIKTALSGDAMTNSSSTNAPSLQGNLAIY